MSIAITQQPFAAQAADPFAVFEVHTTGSVVVRVATSGTTTLNGPLLVGGNIAVSSGSLTANYFRGVALSASYGTPFTITVDGGARVVMEPLLPAAADNTYNYVWDTANVRTQGYHTTWRKGGSNMAYLTSSGGLSAVDIQKNGIALNYSQQGRGAEHPILSNGTAYLVGTNFGEVRFDSGAVPTPSPFSGGAATGYWYLDTRVMLTMYDAVWLGNAKLTLYLRNITQSINYMTENVYIGPGTYAGTHSFLNVSMPRALINETSLSYWRIYAQLDSLPNSGSLCITDAQIWASRYM